MDIDSWAKRPILSGYGRLAQRAVGGSATGASRAAQNLGGRGARHSYEQTVGAIQSPNHFLQLLTQDPWFAWLQPLSQLIVSLDVLEEAEEPLTGATVDMAIKEARLLLTPSEAGEGFSRHYYDALQADAGCGHRPRGCDEAFRAVEEVTKAGCRCRYRPGPPCVKDRCATSTLIGKVVARVGNSPTSPLCKRGILILN